MKEERAIFAGGCFWGMQDLIRPLPSANQWQFSFTPYGWMTSVNGNVTAPGKKGITPRLSFTILW
jgi:peptide methionine sulfoxide reductase MsrA